MIRQAAAELAPATGAVRDPAPFEVAIVGMASMFPGATSAGRVLDQHRERRERHHRGADLALGPRALLRPRGHDGRGRAQDARPSGAASCPRSAFDPLAYGIPPASLAAIEPVQLLSLEVATRALDDAGYADREFDRTRASVVFGAEGGNDLAGGYGLRAMVPQLLGDVPPELDGYLPALTEDSFPGVLTNVIAGRIANRLDLGGINFTVDAACAASLAALDSACAQLAAGTSDLVLCGGADLHNGINDFLLFSSVHALSPTGQCRTFDAAADGIALGEGVACVVLKRLADAERDGDRIYAVIDGVGGSSDGRHLGLTAPRKEGQQRAVERALAQARRSPAEVGLVEAHGTGTVVGDRTELATLTEVFAAHDAEVGACVLGSVKSQIGHTKCAAGLAGLIKVARSLYHGVLPPTGNLVVAQPGLRRVDQPVPVPGPGPAVGRRPAAGGRERLRLRRHQLPRRALRLHRRRRAAIGVETWPAELFVFRAEQAAEAIERVAQLSTVVDAILESDPQGQRHRLRDLAATVCAAGQGPVQVAVVAADLADLADKLVVARSGTAAARRRVPGRARPVAAGAAGLPLPGSGQPAHRHAGRPVRGLPPSARPAARGSGVDRGAVSAHRLQRRGDGPRRPRPSPTPGSRSRRSGCASWPSPGCWRRSGCAPRSPAGTATASWRRWPPPACSAPSDLLALSQARGQAIVDAAGEHGDDAGAMAAISGSAGAVGELLEAHPGAVVANHNSPSQIVIAGPTEVVDRVVEAAGRAGMAAKTLNVACAFHSPLLAGASPRLAEVLESMSMASPEVPVWANTTAEPYPSEPDEIRRLLAAQVASPVRFVDQIEAMYAAGVRVFVEAGPGRVLTQLVDKILGDRPHRAIATDVSGEPGLRRFLLALAELATAGVAVDTDELFDGRVEPVRLADLPGPGPGLDGGRAPGAHRVGPGRARIAAARRRVPVPRHRRRWSTPSAKRRCSTTSRTCARRWRPNGTSCSATSGRATASATVPRVLDATSSPAVPAAAEPDIVLTDDGSASVAAPDRLRGDDLLGVVLQLVADRTGYPTDMLDPDLDLEADLSIDSIKRIEIIGELAERLGWDTMGDEGIDEAMVEELAQLKSLREIVAWIDELDDHDDRADRRRAGGRTHRSNGRPGRLVPPTGPATEPSASPGEVEPPPATTRYVVTTVDLDPLEPETRRIDGHRHRHRRRPARSGVRGGRPAPGARCIGVDPGRRRAARTRPSSGCWARPTGSSGCGPCTPTWPPTRGPSTPGPSSPGGNQPCSARSPPWSRPPPAPGRS